MCVLRVCARVFPEYVNGYIVKLICSEQIFFGGASLLFSYKEGEREVSYKMMLKTQKNVPKNTWVFFSASDRPIVEPLSPPMQWKKIE